VARIANSQLVVQNAIYRPEVADVKSNCSYRIAKQGERTGEARLLLKRGFDSGRFYTALNDTRRVRNLQWRQVAEESGVSASTLTRMAQGKGPDVDGLAALTQWSGLDPKNFFAGETSRQSDLETVLTYLRSASELSPEEAESIAQIVRGAWELAKKRVAEK
jgi:transcriptional regulator with XRE-family HTH domain